MELLIINSTIVWLVLLLYVVLIFFLAQAKSDNSIMDIAYGPAFFVSLSLAIYLTQSQALLPNIVIFCIGLWTVRLSFRIFRKNRGKPEDARYATWREEWNKKGRAYFLTRSFLQINLLQAIIIWIVSFPAILAFTFSAEYSNSFLIVGIIIFAFGLTYETVADWQLDRFIKNKQSGRETANIMKTGLFKYSRRPNYFGETLVWWGLTLITLPLPYGWLGLASPVLITFIVTKVTGPMLEKIFLEKYPEEYGQYQTETSYIVPFLK